MTPAELGLTQEEHDALLWVRNCLDPEHPQKMPDWMKFDMDVWVFQTSCGTACCIGGSVDTVLLGLFGPQEPPNLERQISDSERWLELSSARSREMKARGQPGLYNLFFNWTAPSDAEHAVKAIDRYLAGSSNPWNSPNV